MKKTKQTEEMKMEIDVAIIGAGAVGLAIAAETAKEGREVYAFERHEKFGLETSDRNSEVIHAGLYYKPGSLQAELCARGRELIYQFGKDYGVPCKKLGKLIVAVDESEVSKLEEIFNNATANGVPGLQMLDKKEVRKLEPNVTAVAAIHSPETGIVSAHGLMKYFVKKGGDNSGGVEPLLCGADIVGIEKVAEGYRLKIGGEDEPVVARVLVNSAGLNSDRIAELAGIDVDDAGYRLHYCKGEYFAVSHKHKGKLSRLVYPVPEEAGLGVHATLDMYGEVKLGPNTVYLDDHTPDYTVEGGHQKEFFESAKRFMPFLEYKDLGPDQAGIRPKLFGPGQPKRDFVIQEESARGFPGLINLVGIESPGLTASPAIGEYVGKIVDGLLAGGGKNAGP